MSRKSNPDDIGVVLSWEMSASRRHELFGARCGLPETSFQISRGTGESSNHTPIIFVPAMETPDGASADKSWSIDGFSRSPSVAKIF